MKLTKKQIRQIKKFALDYYKKQDKPHNIWHAYKTVELAKYIAKKEEADMQICEMGALLHQFHPENLKTVKKFLKKINVDKNMMRHLLHCVECTTRQTIHKAKTLEAKVVFDADKLQAIGPLGLMRELPYLNEANNSDFTKTISKIKEVQRSCYRLLQTKTAKKMAKKPYDCVAKLLKIGWVG